MTVIYIISNQNSEPLRGHKAVQSLSVESSMSSKTFVSTKTLEIHQLTFMLQEPSFIVITNIMISMKLFEVVKFLQLNGVIKIRLLNISDKAMPEIFCVSHDPIDLM